MMMKKIMTVFAVMAMSAMLAINVSAGDGKTATLNLNVVGMHCGGCAGKVKAALAGIEGVKEVQSVSAQEKSAVLTFDPSKVSQEKIVEELGKKTGYAISVNKAGGKTETEAKAACCKGAGKTCTAEAKAACAKSGSSKCSSKKGNK
jgi:copper chaperone